MTLRVRLVAALVLLVAVAQAGFFAGTYGLYRNSEYERLDAQLRSSGPLIDTQLDKAAGITGTTGPSSATTGHGGALPAATSPDPDEGGAPQVVIPPSTYAELRSPSGQVLSHIFQLSGTSAAPKLPRLGRITTSGSVFTVPAQTGNGSFRVLAIAGHGGTITIIAIPTTEVARALHELVLIEAGALGALLAVLSGGAWLILYRGLRPLERMARTARAISSGDLTQRVRPSRRAGEVAQLGLALDAMLDDIEASFAEQEATEARLRQFLADASHELRTPLTSIRGFAELFRLGGDKGRVDLPTVLRRIEEESARMKDLVEDLLLLARLDRTRVSERRHVDLAVVGADACSDAVASDFARAVTLDAPEPVIASVDPSHLRQAVANLVSNALRHTPPGSPLQVRCPSRATQGRAVRTRPRPGPGRRRPRPCL